jgi:hypothetical protein
MLLLTYQVQIDAADETEATMCTINPPLKM